MNPVSYAASVALIEQHGELTRQLAEAYRELAEVRAAITITRADAWHEYADLNVTERREHVTHSTAQLSADAAKLDGEVDALRAELANVALRAEYARD